MGIIKSSTGSHREEVRESAVEVTDDRRYRLYTPEQEILTNVSFSQDLNHHLSFNQDSIAKFDNGRGEITQPSLARSSDAYNGCLNQKAFATTLEGPSLRHMLESKSSLAHMQ